MDSCAQLTTNVIEATQQQMKSAQNMAEGVAKVAAESAVMAAMKQAPPPVSTIAYESDFESSYYQPDRLVL